MLRVIAILAAFCLSSAVCTAAARSDTQDFLRDYRHAQLPYPFPAETSLEELRKVVDMGFDTVGVSFAGPYNGGEMDFAKLDEAVGLIANAGQRTVLHLTPRFHEWEQVSDRLDNGKVITNIWTKNPNYSIVDIFDPDQRAKVVDYMKRCAVRYGKDKRVAAFVVGWGYQGETGFHNGDWLTKYEYMGAECAGYSEYALREFNDWRARKKLSPLEELPRPSTGEQSRDYVLFHRFRSEFVRDVFQKEMVAVVQAHTNAPVGIFAYIPADTNSYARNWTDTPNADFYRSAASAASYDLSRTLLDSGMGYEDSWLHDGEWDYTVAAMERDAARQIAKGAVFHVMYIRVYDSDPQWERGLLEKVARFHKTQQLKKKVCRSEPTVALYQPSWGASALPARSESQPFVPKVEYLNHLCKVLGLVESFGLRHTIVAEADLLDASRLRRFRHIIVPMWDRMPKVVGTGRYHMLAKDRRVLGIPLGERPLTRTEFRQLIREAGIASYLDYDSDKALAGRVHNLVYNWGKEPIRVSVPERKDEIELKTYEYVFLGED